MQKEITQRGPLLDESGRLTQVGWSRQPVLDCNLDAASFYAAPLRPLQFLRVKRWDYYAVFTPRRFFSATIADLGYAGNIFVYQIDFGTNELVASERVVPLGRGVTLPRNSTEGRSHFEGSGVSLDFQMAGECRNLRVHWPRFHGGRDLHAEISLACPLIYESMNIVIPIGTRRFYFNRKMNCLPASGFIQDGDEREELHPGESLGSLDWGRGVWEYSSYWNWASASGSLPDGRRVGLNLGCGFGDLSAATENALILENKIHKLDAVRFDYDPHDYTRPWKFTDSQGRLDLTFTPFKERVAKTSLVVIQSEVHQMFGRYKGRVVADGGEVIEIDGLIGFAEEHHARW